ncbi:TlpA disulfide reductase family protein [Granulosicoccus antarcticus]|nr:TlpA disulfide reductase family protein [Granulosicoccus antarcticus]
MKYRFRWLTGICLLATALLASCSNRTELDDSVAQLSFSTLDGQQIAVADIDSPLFVNFWSTTCAICLAEMPELASLYDDYTPHGVKVIAVAMPYDPPNDVLELAQAQQFPFPVALDLKGDAVAAFGPVQGTPISFLMDSDGRLVKRYVGAIEFDALRDELDKLLELG